VTKGAPPDGGRRNASAWERRELLDRLGHRVGRIETVHDDQQTGCPMWAAVQIGLFATRRALVPLVGAREQGERVRVPVDKEHILRGPRIDRGSTIAHDTEAALYRHYRIERSQPLSAPAAGRPEGGGRQGEGGGSQAEGGGSAGEGGGSGETAMTRSEEELSVGTTRRKTGRVRVRKYVVTEHVQRTIPVRREEIRVEHEPMAEEQRGGGQGLEEVSDEHEITLREEVPVVEKRVVPRERVRVTKGTRVDRAEVKERVRRERIEPEGDLGP
jgi:uncharacterized protein (TIGR02271 family)